MIVETFMLGSIALTYKPPVSPPVEVGYLVPQIALVEPLALETTLRPIEPIKPLIPPSTGLNGYYLGQCTGFVASKRYVPPGWGNASDWRDSAIAAGWVVSDIPVAGAIGWTPGHVVYIEAVNEDGSVTISEQNYDWNSGIRTISMPVSKYVYIY